MKATFHLSIVLGIMLVVNSFNVFAKPADGSAPDFTLKSASGENLRLQEHRGDVVMLNFWASWCGPCRQEMPYLEEIYKKYKKFGFTILAVNVDEDSTLANQFLSDMDITFPILYDNTNKVSELYNVEAMPTTVIIDRNGKKRFLHLGYQPGFEEHYRDEIKRLIRE